MFVWTTELWIAIGCRQALRPLLFSSDACYGNRSSSCAELERPPPRCRRDGMGVRTWPSSAKAIFRKGHFHEACLRHRRSGFAFAISLGARLLACRAWHRGELRTRTGVERRAGRLHHADFASAAIAAATSPCRIRRRHSASSTRRRSSRAAACRGEYGLARRRRPAARRQHRCAWFRRQSRPGDAGLANDDEHGARARRRRRGARDRHGTHAVRCRARDRREPVGGARRRSRRRPAAAGGNRRRSIACRRFCRTSISSPTRPRSAWSGSLATVSLSRD